MTVITENVIVAGIDGSAAATAAALWAAQEARRRRAGLRLVQAYPAAMAVARHGVTSTPDSRDPVQHHAQQLLMDSRDVVADAYPDLDIEIELHRGNPVTVLTNASAGVLLTVLGSHGERQFPASLIGSVAQRVAAHAHGPVVVVRPTPDGDDEPGDADGPVLVGLDGSTGCTEALSFAFEQASLRGVELIAMHSWDDDARPGSISYHSPAQDRVRFQEEQRFLAEQLAGWAEKYPDVGVRPMVVRGQPAAAIMGDRGASAKGRRPSLIVVGSRGRGGFAGLLLGSTSQALIAHAGCPVAVVR